jgi:ThiF family protein
MPPLRPQLKPALRRVWRDESTLQLGLDPQHAVIISGLDAPAAQLVESLDGTRDRGAVFAGAAGLGLDAWRVDELLGLLEQCGVLDDAADRRPLAGWSQLERERLAPDLAAQSVVRRGADGGASVLGRRRTRVVSVRGAGRVGASIVTLLAAAGVGAVLVEDGGTTSGADTAPAGSASDDIGTRRQDAAMRAARRVAPAVRSSLPRGRRAADLVVLAPVSLVDPEVPDRLLRRGVAHLFAGVRDGTGVVGPLVIPGHSSCHRCHDLHRADRDPAWPRVAAQLTGNPRPADAPPCDVVLATAVAAQAATQVLALLDGDPSPPAVDGTIELTQTDGRVRRRGWSVHPLCGCGWSRG